MCRSAMVNRKYTFKLGEVCPGEFVVRVNETKVETTKKLLVASFIYLVHFEKVLTIQPK